jgi:Mn-containing catalase
MKHYASDYSEVWHYAPEECMKVNEPEKHVDRPQSYLDYHELKPCPECHPHLETPRAEDLGVEISNIAKTLRYGD